MSIRAVVFCLAASVSVPTIAAEQEFYELRLYHNAEAEKQNLVLSHLESALIPALNRYGSRSVGVFTPQPKDGAPSADVYVLIPFASLENFSGLNGALAADGEYQSASANLLAEPARNPTYTRIESRLMKAFAGMPKLALPSKESPDRILELRIYESHNAEKARLKVEMFNEGEIGIMQDVKLAPVFFGESLISSDLPNLTYMLSADNADVHKQHFGDFSKHPEWSRMKVIQKYKGTVSRIRSVMLNPAKCSQI